MYAHKKSLKLVSHSDAKILQLVGDKGLRYKRDFLNFHFAVTLDLCSRHIYNYIDGHSYDSHETFAQASHDSRETFM